MNTEQIKNAVEKYHNYIVEMRREFHRYPEVSGKEQHTREILVRELEKIGVPYRLLPGTGLIGIMEGGKPGKHRVVRADIDALPITEAKENLALAQTKLSAGTITQLDLLTAQENVQTAENNLTQLENTIKNLKENFQVLLGWSYNDSPEIGSLTDVDENEIAAMNPDTDLAQAIENNYTLKINERKLENAKNETVKNQLTTAIANNKKQIGASLSGAYKKVLSAQISLQQAQTKAQLEQTNLSNAALKMAAGMMTKNDYDAQERAAKTSENSVKTAQISLLSAVENYKWAVKGLAAAQ